MANIKYKTTSEAYADFNRKQLNREVSFIEKYNLSISSFYYIKFLFFEDYHNLYKLLREDNDSVISACNFKINREDVNGLHSKGIVKKNWTIREEFPDDNELKNIFLSEISEVFGINPDTMRKITQENKQKKDFIELAGNQLFRAYPNKVGNIGPLKACKPFTYNNKTYQGKDETVSLYCNLIDFDTTIHNEIIDKIEADASRGYEYCSMGITSFITNRTWEDMPSVKTKMGGINL